MGSQGRPRTNILVLCCNVEVHPFPDHWSFDPVVTCNQSGASTRTKSVPMCHVAEQFSFYVIRIITAVLIYLYIAAHYSSFSTGSRPLFTRSLFTARLKLCCSIKLFCSPKWDSLKTLNMVRLNLCNPTCPLPLQAYQQIMHTFLVQYDLTVLKQSVANNYI